MLNIQNISFSYRRKANPVINGYSLTVDPGSICGLLGPNGAGKSTILYLIAGLLRPSSGSIVYNGFTPGKRNTAFLEETFIVPEEFALPDVSLKRYVEANAAFYPKFSNDDLAGHLDTFELNPDLRLNQLSMGQKKRVFIAFALATNTSLLLLDEPTNGLDIPGKRLFRKAILNGMTDDKTIIISTHQVFDIEKILDHVVITGTNGPALNTGVADITSKLSFSFTPDRNRALKALSYIEVPGGYQIVENNVSGDETDLNLESLFELTRQKPETINAIFNR